MQLAQRDVVQAYRGLLRTAKAINTERFGHPEGSLQHHVQFRIRSEKMLMLSDDEPYTSDDLERAVLRMQTINTVLDKMVVLEPSQAPSLFSFLSATQHPGGNPQYHRELENGLVRMAAFHDAYQARVGLEEQRGAATKNRALQFACRDHAEVLALMEANPINQRDSVSFTALFEVRQGGDVEYTVLQAPETILCEIDHERKRTTIYTQTHIDAAEDDDDNVVMQDWGLEPEGVSFPEEYHQAALRVVRELMENKAKVLPQGYAVCLAGHAVGGAISAIAAAYLKNEHSLMVTNIVTFGSPRVTTTLGCLALTELPWTRFVMPLDIKRNLPRLTIKGHHFFLYGEELSLLPSRLAKIATDEFIEENQLHVTMEEYNAVMQEDTAVLEFTPPPEYMHQESPKGGDMATIDPEDISYGEFIAKRSSTRKKDRKKK